jgi:hypothetical protein
MASTYTPADGIAVVKEFVHGIPLDTIGPMACDMVNSIMWRAYFWRWTIKSMTPVNLVNGQQDYIGTIPSDFHRIKAMRLARTDLSPVEYREINVLNYLAPELTMLGTVDNIRDVSIQAEIPGFRLARPPNIQSPITMQLQGEYQYLPTKITDGNLSIAFPFPDAYFNVFFEGLKWRIYKFADDPRAGTLQANREGVFQATGQLGEFVKALNDMTRSEDLGDGDLPIFPDSPMGWTRTANPGLFGY